MLKDYHMHPAIMQNPSAFDEFARCAIEKGIHEVCITDHMPLSISSAVDRIPSGMVKAYCRNVREVAKKYEGTLSVKLGIEVDYHPQFISEIESVLGDGDFDYILGSTHMHLFLADKLLDRSMSKKEFARLALENTFAAVESGYFHTISHLDMFRWVFSRPDRFLLSDEEYYVEDHTGEISKILDEIQKRDICLEINAHLAESKNDVQYTYPQDIIVQMALDRNIRFYYGSDAHKPQSVGAMLDSILEHPVYGKALGGKNDENI